MQTSSEDRQIAPNGSAMMSLAVVGYGFIGSRIARLAAAAGHDVRAIARHPRPDEPGVDFVDGDVADLATARALLDGVQHVVYAAGTAKPAESNADPLYDAERNLRPLLATLQVCAEVGVQHFTFLSSGGQIYGPDAPVPAREADPTWPVSSYGVLKLAAERYVGMYAQLNGMTADILRCSNVYGPGEPTAGSQGLMGIARAALASGQPVIVYGDGETRRDYVHVDDVADVVLRLACVPDRVRLLNVGSGDDESVLEIVDLVAAQADTSAVVEHRPSRSTDVPVVRLCIERIQEVIPFKPRSVAEGLGVVQETRTT